MLSSHCFLGAPLVPSIAPSISAKCGQLTDTSSHHIDEMDGWMDEWMDEMQTWMWFPMYHSRGKISLQYEFQYNLFVCSYDNDHNPSLAPHLNWPHLIGSADFMYRRSTP